MPSSERAVAQQREQFLGAGAQPRSVREEIAVSWRRCSQLSVQAERITPRFAPDIDPETPLLRAARPVLAHINERLGDLGISFLLTDASARIIERCSSNRGLIARLDGVSAAEGFVFAESEVGTNGVGTAIELGRPVRVDGHEHYAEDLHQFTCIGIPIRGMDRRLHGLLDVSSAADHHNTVIALIAEQTAEKIEQRLVDQQSVGERALLDRFLAASRRGRSDFFVVNDRVLITSPRAARLLDGVEQALVWEHISALLGEPGRHVHELVLPDGRHVSVSVEPLQAGGDGLGAMVDIGPQRDPRPARLGVSPAPRALPGLLGSDRSWLQACQDARSAARTNIVVLHGEPGVGKNAVAAALHAERRLGPLVQHDATAMTVAGPSSWLTTLQHERRADPGTLVVRRIDRLSPPVARAVGAILLEALRRGWQCLATCGESPGQVVSALGGEDIVAVALPPLRNRPEDLLTLARSFAAPRRIAADVSALFLRMPWPDNVRGLQTAVERFAGTSELRLSDLPDELRSHAFRRRMTRFEHAELRVILDALTEAHGNKKAAAMLLGISRSTLYRRLESAGIPTG